MNEWYIGFLGSVLGGVGVYFFFLSLQKMSGNLRVSMGYLFLAATSVFLFSIFLNIFGFAQLGIDDPLWNIPGVFTVLAAGFYVISMRRLNVLLERLIRQAKLKKRIMGGA